METTEDVGTVFVVERHDDAYEGPHSMRIARDVRAAVQIAFEELSNVGHVRDDDVGGWRVEGHQSHGRERMTLYPTDRSGRVSVSMKSVEVANSD